MTSDPAQARDATVFSCALECCAKLQQEFPADQRLRSIIEQLQHWVAAQNAGGKPAARKYRQRHIDPRDLRPLSEEVAALVHKAAAKAQELKLS
jgi:hypothetical protein